MEVTKKIGGIVASGMAKLKSVFVTKSDVSDKIEIKGRSVKLLVFSFVLIFIVIALAMPSPKHIQFEHVAQATSRANSSQSTASSTAQTGNTDSSAEALWGDPRPSLPSGGIAQNNLNTPMILNGGKNSKTRVPAGVHLHLKLLDSFTTSDDPVPVLAELTLSATTDSGLTLPQGTEFYGEANFDRQSSRATVQFQQISLPSGQIKNVSGIAIGSDGLPGISGDVHSDAVKNTAGELITSFVGGFASGSMRTNILGGSSGGVQNGLLNAASETARNLAQSYGNKLKTEREWITVKTGTEFDAILTTSLNVQTLNLQNSGVAGD